MSDPIIAIVVAKYDALCAQRDAKYAESAPVQKQLDEVNAKIQELYVQSHELAKEIETIWGGADWIRLKKDIASIAYTAEKEKERLRMSKVRKVVDNTKE